MTLETSAVYKGKRIRERGQRPTLRGALMILLPALAMVAAVAAVLYFANRTDRYTVQGPAVQYYAGSVYRISSGSKLKRSRAGETVLTRNSSRRTMTSLVVYYEDQQKILLPQNMIYYDPRSGSSGRLNYFTELVYQDNGTVTAQRYEDSAPLYQGFLYDGEDFYLFLEPTVLTFNGYRIELGAMSYVEAVYTGQIMVYDRESGEMMMEAPTGAVKVQAVSGDYTVSLLSDSMESYDGSKTLLITRPELLDQIV